MATNAKDNAKDEVWITQIHLKDSDDIIVGTELSFFKRISWEPGGILMYTEKGNWNFIPYHRIHGVESRKFKG